jgi:hypothetical protein
MKNRVGVSLVAVSLFLAGAVGGVVRNGWATSANGLAETASILPEFAVDGPEGGAARAACSITNMQGSIASGYLNWPVPGGGMAVYFDPEGTGGSGDPGCGANPYSFLIESVDLEFADASMFEGIDPGEGYGTLEFTVGIECPWTDSDPCSEPGTEIFRSGTVTMTVPPEGSLRQFNVPVNVCVDGPFFVVVHYESWSGAVDRVASLLWDGVVRPSCRQWITTSGGSSWTDHEDYFSPPGNDAGWADFVVNGNTQDACGPSGNCGGPPPTGACCLPIGSCVDDVTAAECETTYEGEWQGADTECASIECPQPPPGACCDAEAYCTEETVFDCVGTWLGADTVCGADCDSDGATDACVIALGMSLDCQPNDIPDECDIDDGTSLDINDNNVPDECECPPGNGDANNDAVVDLVDYAVFESCIAGPQIPYGVDCEALDMDGDCDVDLADFGKFQAAFGSIAPIVPTELAGNSLSEYPFFEYVKAFNEDSTVEVAIDPTRFPQIVGRTCDIYIVEAKTAGQWLADPSLVDVTIGGPQTETFGGTTIQANTFTVAGPYELDSAVYDDSTGDYTGLGAGYDMVLDCDRDGYLGGGDFIDGYSREAGLYAVHDTAAQGPLPVTRISSYSVGAIYGIPADQTYERLYFPTDIASMDPLPLIVVSHGNGHMYTWYDHIGYHMASYGYIVMSHNNDTVPGIATCSLTTCGHTDAVISLGQAGAIAGAEAIAGKIDTSRIIWIGHSRGAEGVAMAYHRIAYATGSCQYTPDPANNWDADSIVLVSSMLPTDFYGANYQPYLDGCVSDPGDVNYHLWTASGDDDVYGGPDSDVAQTFHLHDRAERFRGSTVVQGTGHGDFHASSGSVFCEGCPCHIVPKDRVHDIMQGLFLPMIKYYAEGNIPGLDFLWRQYESFHPIGVPEGQDPCIVVNNTFRNGADEGNFVIDDYQTQTSTGTSSSGGSVTYSVSNVYEGRLDDANSLFTWSASDPMNGFTYGATTVPDDTRGVVFDWNGADAYYEWEIIAAQQDFSDDLYLSFRAAQGPRHPYTIAVLGDLTFTVTLRDGSATTSSINIGAYGGGIEEPYQRTGFGTGTGWAAEFEVIRIRVTDFLNNGSGLDLTDIAAVRLDVGPSWGSNEGRIGVDDVMLTNDHAPYFTLLTLSVTAPPPEFLPPGVPTVIEVEILEGSDTIVPDSALLHYRYDGGTWLSTPLVQTAPGSELWEGTLPAPSCSDAPEFYFAVEASVTGVVYDPPTGPSAPYTAFVGTYDAIMVDDFETDQGWTVEDDPTLTDGSWERGIPVGLGERYDPPTDYDGSGKCYLTANRYGNSDVDGGATRLISPTIDLSTSTNPVLRYARWWANDDQDADPFDVEVSNDNGSTWYPIETVINIPEGWVERTVYITAYISPLTDQMKFRFTAADYGGLSVDEGGVDAFEIFNIQCSD